LIGESYGTFRSAAPFHYFANHDGMYFNGIVLISSVLDSDDFLNPGDDQAYNSFICRAMPRPAWYPGARESPRQVSTP